MQFKTFINIFVYVHDNYIAIICTTAY